MRGIDSLQRLGRGLMLPVTVLPVAALMVRISNKDMLGHFQCLAPYVSVIGAAGNQIFLHLPLLFAVGVAVSWVPRSDGSTAITALVGYLVMHGVFVAMTPAVMGTPYSTDVPHIDYGVIGGMLCGLISAHIWSRCRRINPPGALGFFGGRRLPPMVAGIVMVGVGVVLGLLYPYFAWGLDRLSAFVETSGTFGAGVYGVANRLLLPLGLHHILNSAVWYVLGDYHGTYGDMNRFFAGDPSAGTFMTGFFPVMMFGLPAGVAATVCEARKENRKKVRGGAIPMVLTCVITGITEPIEFTFLITAWPLLVLHAFLTGSSMVVCNLLGIRDGFAFSAGLFDYILNYTQATKPLLLLGVGVCYAFIYFFSFRFLIRRLDLNTYGRKALLDREPGIDTEVETTSSEDSSSTKPSVAVTDAAAKPDPTETIRNED